MRESLNDNYTLARRQIETGDRRDKEKRFLPCLDLAVIGHRARELVVELPQGGHVRQGRAQKVTSQRLVANVADVVVAEEDTAAEVVDTLDGGDTEALNTPQEILEGNQIPEAVVYTED